MSAIRVLAHGLVLMGLLADVAQLVLMPPTFATLLPWGLAATALPVTASIVGWALAVRRPRLSLGWLLLAIGVLVSTETAIGAIGLHLPHSAWGQWLLWYGGPDQWAWIPPIGLLFTQVPLRFPDGRLPSSGWRWFSRFTIVALVITSAVFATVERWLPGRVPNPTFVDWGDLAVLVAAIPGALTAVAFAGSIGSLFVRYRRSSEVQRAQLRWIFWAAAVVAGLLVVSWFGDYTKPGVAGSVDLILSSAAALAYSLIPLAILFAVTRRGLYAIDRIISRTAAYSVVTLAVVGTYLAAVLLLSLLLPNQQALGVAVPTLAAAAVFLPLLRFVRRAIDRRFNRAQYDAEKVVEAFGERVRNGADPHTAGADLLDAVERTLQPSAVGIWTREVER